MHVNDHRIRFLFQSWKSGSMRAASEMLDVAPSSISRQIAQLEQELGLPLIEHGRRDIRLTEAGERVIAYYMDQVANQETLLSQLRDFSGNRTGRIRIALGEGFLGEALYATMDEFQDRFPGIALSIRLTDTTEMLRLLADDEVHFGLAFHPPADARINSRFSARVPLKVIAVPDHPIAKLDSVRLADLVAHPIALMDQRFRIRQLIDVAEAEPRIRLTPVITTNSIALLVRTALAGRALTILPELGLRAYIDGGQLVAVPLAEPLLQSLYAHLVTRANRQFSTAALFLMQRVRERLGPIAK